jgi:hypothetical protein
MRLLLFLLCLGLAVPANAQSGCQTVMLPDLGPIGETPVTGGIATGFLVPPASTQLAGAFYPFALFSEANGNVGIDQYDVGVNTKRRWTNVSSISLVYWLSFNDPLLPLVYTGYKTLVNSVPLGTFPLPTWAYRIVERFAQPLASFNLSKPVQLGEGYSVAIENPLPYPVWANLQIEARICR